MLGHRHQAKQPYHPQATMTTPNGARRILQGTNSVGRLHFNGSLGLFLLVDLDELDLIHHRHSIHHFTENCAAEKLQPFTNNKEGLHEAQLVGVTKKLHRKL